MCLRRENSKELWAVRIVALSMCTIAVVLALNSFGLALNEGASLPEDGPASDFSGFYAPAKLVWSAPEQLYDPAVQERTQREVTGYPMTGLVFAHAPFLAVILSPLALLPFQAAYFTWMGVSAVLYGGAVRLLAPVHLRPWALPLAFASPLFPLYVATAGQVTAVAFAAVALGMHLESRGRPYLSGLALSLCAHKPVLPALILVMLALTGRFRALIGMLSGITVLAGVSFLAVGSAGCVAWVKLMLFYGNVARSGGMQLIRYVDLNTLARLLPLPAPIGAVLAVALGSGVIGLVAYVWRRRIPEAVWAVTLAAAMVLSPYTPVYEGIYLVLALVSLVRLDGSEPAIALVLFTCIAGFATQFTAALFGLPLLTVAAVLIALRAAQLSRKAVPLSSAAAR